jgi:hypothetical protein
MPQIIFIDHAGEKRLPGKNNGAAPAGLPTGDIPFVYSIG